MCFWAQWPVRHPSKLEKLDVTDNPPDSKTFKTPSAKGRRMRIMAYCCLVLLIRNSTPNNNKGLMRSRAFQGGTDTECLQPDVCCMDASHRPRRCVFQDPALIILSFSVIRPAHASTSARALLARGQVANGIFELNSTSITPSYIIRVLMNDSNYSPRVP